MTELDILPADLRARSGAAARSIMSRLIDRRAISDAVAVAQRDTDLDIWWDGVSVYSGATGLAMAFSHASRVFGLGEDEWSLHAREWLRHAVDKTHEDPVRALGMSDGTAGLALVLSHFAADDGRYSRTVDSVHEKLAEQVNGLSGWSDHSLYWDSYDVIAGRAGILGYASSIQSASPAMQRCIQRLVDQLLELCEGDTDPWRAWRIPRENYPQRDKTDRHLFGYVDLGLAHGIPGPMAALSHAWTAGYRSARIEQAIRGLAGMLIDAAWEDRWGLVWPRFMPFDESGAIVPDTAPEAGSVYCYGGPGICSALLDVAEALGDHSIRDVAVDGFEAALLRLQHIGIPAYSSLCHGVAGLLLICRKFALRTDSQAARTGLVALTEQLLDRCDPQLPLVIQEYRPPVETAEGPRRQSYNSPSLLEGSAGVALSLLSVTSSVAPEWARALLVE